MAPQKVALSRKQIGGEVPMVATEITDTCIYSGLFGSLDSSRMAIIIDKVTTIASARQISLVIVDLGNVEAIDSSVAGHLVKLGDVLRLVGVIPIFCGISSELAKTMISAGVNLGRYITCRDLKSALIKSLELSNQKIVDI
ncbi:STAS domain-containing protein [Colwellia psychrerythraea]|uniref:Anti-sigma-factor antagonist n=1 Tax=Colwellia psychrerythraea TaxID=28229 RepID=A0A099KYP2_COLPS|nr:STAS domain-containing protein [Colwellia psychrerythraea]KGJ94967.1 anti-sigma-factor antagonist [Colwellia psychrerythraea]